MVTRETECLSQPPFSSYLHKIANWGINNFMQVGERILDLYFSTISKFIKREEHLIFTETTSQ